MITKCYQDGEFLGVELEPEEFSALTDKEVRELTDGSIDIGVVRTPEGHLILVQEQEGVLFVPDDDDESEAA